LPQDSFTAYRRRDVIELLVMGHGHWSLGKELLTIDILPGLKAQGFPSLTT
jgi:hypothetical protein